MIKSMGRLLEKNDLFCNTSRQKHCKLEQKSLQSKSEISDLFCKRFLFQLRVYFALKEFQKLPIYIGNLRYI